MTDKLTAAEADKVNLFLDAAKALPKSIAVEVDDGVLTVWKRVPSDWGKRKIHVGALRKKSLDHWE